MKQNHPSIHPSHKTILGIDPGSRFTGYGVIHIDENHHTTCLTSGRIKTQGDQLSDRLYEIYHGIKNAIHNHLPHEVAIEQVFMHRNAQSALKLGQARGAALVAAASLSLPIYEYSPREIKQAIVGYGNAEKSQMQHMIKALLKLDTIPTSDAADALAIALCHSHTQRFKSKVKQAMETSS